MKSADQGNYGLLEEEMHKILRDPNQADKIAETIDGADGDTFRDFDLAVFIRHFRLDPIAAAVLASAFTSCSRSDLRNKAEEYLADILSPLQQSLGRFTESNKNVDNNVLAVLLEKVAISPPRSLLPDRALGLQRAVKDRFHNVGREIPVEISSALRLFSVSLENRTFLQRLQREGPKMTANIESADDLLASLGLDKLDEAEVANAILYMVLSVRSAQYHPEHFVAAVKGKARVKRLDWSKVLAGFDQEGIAVTADQFLRIFNTLKIFDGQDTLFDIQRLWIGTWKHRDTQLSFLNAYLLLPADAIEVEKISQHRPSFTENDFKDCSQDSQKLAQQCLSHRLSSLDTVTAIFDLVLVTEEATETNDGREIIYDCIQNDIELFTISALKISIPRTPCQSQFLERCFQPFLLKKVPQWRFALEGCWTQKREWVFEMLYRCFSHDPMTTGLAVDLAREFDWTAYFLDFFTPYTIDIACELHREDDFDIVEWIKSRAEDSTAETVGTTLMKFLRIKAEDEHRVQKKDQPAPKTVPLALKTIAVLLEVLEEFTPSDSDLLIPLQSLCILTYPRIINYGEGFDEIISKNSESTNVLPDEVEGRMQDVLGKMYRDEVTLTQLLQDMRQYKQSSDPALQDLFACIIHGLFDEYQCYHEYPPEALKKTAVMFGSAINHHLMTGISERVGLGLVLKAVRESMPENPMFKFGVEAISQLTDRFEEWIGFCSRLIQIPQLRGEEIYAKAEDILRQGGHDVDHGVDGLGANGLNDTSMMINGDIDDLLSPDASSQRFKSLNVEPAPKGKFKDPDEHAQDKIMFVLNNLSVENLNSKFSELNEVLESEHFQWFAHYLVESRAKLEPNNQPLYMNVLDMIDDKVLMQEVLRETYMTSIRMLHAETTQSSAPERTLLKNVASWLGALTIAKDKPIKHKNIYFRDLLIEGLDTNRLPIVIPFTCKVLLKGAESTVFRPPNPWLMDIIALLMELYHFMEIRLTMKFEIEVLCKELSLDHKEIEPSTSIRERPEHLDEGIVLAPGLPDGLDAFDDLSLAGLGSSMRNERLSPATIMGNLPNLDAALKYPPSTGDQDLVRSIVHRAFEQAIHEIIAPVVERSITIASISTFQLVQKDFALEVDEDKIREGARNVVKTLAGRLALVTCKEPLKLSVTNFMRHPTHVDVPDGYMAEGSILMCVNDNLDTACSFVEKAAEDRAVMEIDRYFQDDFEQRRQYISSHPQEPFQADRTISNWAKLIPEPYQQALGGLNETQLAVYEDFARQTRGVGTNHAQNASTDSTGRQLPDVLQEPFSMPNLSIPVEQADMPLQLSHNADLRDNGLRGSEIVRHLPRVNGMLEQISPQERLLSAIAELQKLARASGSERVRDISPDDAVSMKFMSVIQIVTNATRQNGEHLARLIAEKVCNSLFTDIETNLEAEIMTRLLAKTCGLSDIVTRDVLRWITGQDESLLVHSAVTVGLVEAELLDPSRIDFIIAKAIMLRKPEALTLLADLLDHAVLNEDASALRANFSGSLEATHAWNSEDPGMVTAAQVIEKLGSTEIPEISGSTANERQQSRHDQMEYTFNEWIALFQSSPMSEESSAAFLKDMHQKQIISSQEDSLYFLRYCLDFCLESYDHEANIPNGSVYEAFAPTDALAKMIISLVRFQGENEGSVQLQKAAYLDSLLSTVVLLLNFQHVTREEQFNQRVFFRLFSNILLEYSASGMKDTMDHPKMVVKIAQTFSKLQPAHFPGFAYSWLMLISHRVFLPDILSLENSQGWKEYCELIQIMLRYVGELTNSSRFSAAVVELYRGVLRLLLILHHDYPEFVANNHFQFCNAIPPHCTQLRNLILSAYPSSFAELPDPFTSGLKADRLEEMKKPPKMTFDVAEFLGKINLKQLADNAMRKGDTDSATSQIIERVERGLGAQGKLDISLMNAVVLYIGQDALATTPNKFVAISPHAALFSNLARSFGPEARYHMLNAMANHLRYPNSHTHFFISCMLHLFGIESEGQQEENVRQQIVRVILERLIVHRPHPWGLLISLLELDHNTAYKFWELPFIAAAPEVRSLAVELYKKY